MAAIKLPDLKIKLAKIKSTTPNVADLSNDSLADDSIVNCLALWLDTHRPRDIILENCSITDKAMHMISCFCRNNENLRYINLRNNLIGEKGCSILSELCYTNKFIESIDLFGNPLLESSSASMQDVMNLVEAFESSQHLKSLCGCTPQSPEFTLVKPLSEDFESTFIAADLRKNSHMKSLQFAGTHGTTQILDALSVNTTLIRLKINAFNMTRLAYSSLKSSLTVNSTLKTIQLSFKQKFSGDFLDNGTIELLCWLFECIGFNSSISTLQIDSMPFNLEIVDAISKLIQQSHSIVHLSLFNMAFNSDQLRSLLYAFEGNNSVRVLHLSDSCEISNDLHSTMETVADVRGYPLTLRVGENEYRYGQTNNKMGGDEWEVEDCVEAFHDGEGWCPATVIVVQKDYKYCVRFNTGQIKVNYRGQLLRRGENFVRHHNIPSPAAAAAASVATQPLSVTTTEESPDNTSAAVNLNDVNTQVSEQYPYRVGQEVEMRFMGDTIWYSAIISKASIPYLVDVTILEEESVKDGMNDEQLFQHEQQLLQYEYPFYLVRDVFPHKDPEGSYYDVGFYQRGDYVEVYRKHFGGWKRGRLAVDRKNGQYDIRFEDHEEQRVRGRYLRHHFKANSSADCRLLNTTEWSRNVTVVNQDKSTQMYTIRYNEGSKAGQEERSVHPRRLMPCERSQFRSWAEQHYNETNNVVSRVTGRNEGVSVLTEIAAAKPLIEPPPAQFKEVVTPTPIVTTTELKVEQPATVLSLTHSTEDISSSPVVEVVTPIPSIAETKRSDSPLKSTPDVTLAFQLHKQLDSSPHKESDTSPNRRQSKPVNKATTSILDDRRPSVRPAVPVNSKENSRRPSTKPAAAIINTEDRRPSVKPSTSSDERDSRKASIRSTDVNVVTGIAKQLAPENVPSVANVVPDYYKGVQVGEMVEVFESIGRRYELRTIHHVNTDGTFDVIDEFGDISYGLNESQLKPKITTKDPSPAVYSQSTAPQSTQQQTAPTKYKVGARIEALIQRHNNSSAEWYSGVVAQYKGSNEYVIVLDDEESDRLVPLSNIRPVKKVVENSVDYTDDINVVRTLLQSAIKPPQELAPSAPSAAPSSHTQSSPVRNQRLAQQPQDNVTKTPSIAGNTIQRTPVTYSSSTAHAIMSANSHLTTSTLSAATINNNDSLLHHVNGPVQRTPVTHHYHTPHHHHTPHSTNSGGSNHSHSPMTLPTATTTLPTIAPKLSPIADKSEGVVSELESKLASQLGIKDTEKCAMVAKCLVQQGCSSWSDLLDLGGLFETGDDKTDIENLRKFLQEANIPMFIAAKLANFIKKS